MAKFTFADRYAQASLAPSPQVISSRQEPANRIVSTVVGTGILDLVGAYYGSPDIDLSWFRDEFAKEDASFSLVNNERETKLLAALILEQLVGKARAEAILAIIAGSVMGLRPPAECEWLLRDAKEALGRFSVANREPQTVETNVTPTYTAKLKEEIAAIERTVPKIGPVQGDQPTAKIIPINKATYHLLLSKFIFSFLSFNK